MLNVTLCWPDRLATEDRDMKTGIKFQDWQDSFPVNIPLAKSISSHSFVTRSYDYPMSGEVVAVRLECVTKPDTWCISSDVG